MSEHAATVRTEYSVVWYDEEDRMPVGPFVVYGADFEPWIPTAELGCIVMANQRTITTSAWTSYELPPTPCAPSCRTLCEGCSPEPLESASDDWLPALASKCREQLDAVPPAAQPSWYRLKGAPRVMPPAETAVERCRRLHGLEPGYVMGCDECESATA